MGRTSLLAMSRRPHPRFRLGPRRPGLRAETGELALVEASPEEHRELSRMAALPGKTWNPPALSGRLLLVRNNRQAVCYELPVEG